jgi:hypothetical protein
MRLLVVAVISSILLSACGCSPVRSVTFCVVDSQGGYPISRAHAAKIAPRVSAPWSWLLLPGGIGPDIEDRNTDERGEVRIDNSNGCWYRVSAKGYKDVEIGQYWLRIHSSKGHRDGMPPRDGAYLYAIKMQRLEQ